MASSLLAVRREYLGCCMMSHAVNNSVLGCHEDVSGELSSTFSRVSVSCLRNCVFVSSSLLPKSAPPQISY